MLLVYMVTVVTVSVIVLVKSSPGKSHILRNWLIVNAVLTVIRTTGWIALHAFPPDDYLRVRVFLLWTIRAVNAVSIAWYIAGIVFVQRKTEQLHMIRSLIIVIIVVELSFLGLSMLLGLLIFLFAVRPVLNGPGATQGASKEDLNRLPTFRYKRALDITEPCSICLCDYEVDELLRRLPCAAGVHIFHASCVDEWLSHNLSCPICREDPLAATLPPEAAQLSRDNLTIADSPV